MTIRRGLFRLVGLDGSPHPVLDAPYESIEAAIGAAKLWREGQGLNSSLGKRSIGVEVKTSCGSWRTISYSLNCLDIGTNNYGNIQSKNYY